MPQYQGVWTIPTAVEAQSNQQWVTDPNFRQTTLLLQADNAAYGLQNNIFLDSSTNNFFITRSGNVTQGSFTPFAPTSTTIANYWSFFTNGGSYISTPGSLTVNNAFTIEFWLFINNIDNTNNRIFDTGNNGDAAAMVIGYGSDGSLGFGPPAGGVTGVGTAAGAVRVGVWQHIALVCTAAGTNGAIFVNGVLKAGPSAFSASGGTNVAFNIGRNNVAAADYSGLNGFISNFRYVSGQRLYSANFTPDIRPFTKNTYTIDGGVTYQTITGTCQLLTAQNGRYVDNSNNGYTLTLNGAAALTPVTPFNPLPLQPQYLTNTVGGSAYFDGSGDYLTLGGQSNFAFGSNPFTIEFWIYPTTVSGGAVVYDQRPSGSSGAQPMISFDGSGFLQYYTNAAYQITATTAMAVNTWNHVALARSGTSTKLFLNGVQTGSTYTDSTVYVNGASRPVIAANGTNLLNPFTGYISNLRVLNNTALYTANFTPPTAPLTAVTNTQLLLNYTNGAIYDGAMYNDFETVSTASVIAYPVKYGVNSIYFNGTNGYLLAQSTQGLTLGLNDFTIEMWLYPTSWATDTATIVRGNGVSGAPILARYGTNNYLGFVVEGSSWIITDAALPTLYTWSHVAVTRANNVFRIFINGQQSGSTSSTVINMTAPIATIGANNNTSFYAGYMDDIRVTNGVARYTSSFIPPQAALPRQ